MNTEHTNQSTAPEPFGYFKAEPFGWTDCEEGDEGAIALYDRPQAAPVARDVLMALAEEVRETCWTVGSGDATIRELDLAAIVDRHAAQIAAAESSAIKLVCDALVAIVGHSGDPAGTVAALAGWRKKAEAFARNPAGQPPAMAVAVPDGYYLVADATLRRAIVSLIDRVASHTLSCNETAVEQLRFINEIAAAQKGGEA